VGSASLALQAKHNIVKVKRCVTTVKLEDLSRIYMPQIWSAINVGKGVGKIKLANQNVNGAKQESTVT
jgi:hypothetical protein